MIIDKMEQYWTDEERQLEKKYNKEGKDAEVVGLTIKVRIRYAESRKADGLVKDAKMTIDALEKRDFQEYCFRRKKAYTRLDPDLRRELYLNCVENYENCQTFLIGVVGAQLLGTIRLKEKEACNTIQDYIKACACNWYDSPENPYKKIIHNPIISNMEYMQTKNAKTEGLERDAVITNKKGDFTLKIKHSDKHALSPATDKLFKIILEEFTKNNRMGSKNPETFVSFSIDDYAKRVGKDISTPTKKKNFARGVRKNLDTLGDVCFSWEGRGVDFDEIPIIGRKTIKKGMVGARVTYDVACFFNRHSVISRYPDQIMKIDDRNPTAYYLGIKLVEYYSIPNNHRQGRADLISVKSLLRYSNLSFETKEMKKHWREKIKEPLEKALDDLHDVGILKDYEYTKAKGEPFPDDHLEFINSYQDFLNLYVKFSLYENAIIDYGINHIASKQQKSTV